MNALKKSGKRILKTFILSINFFFVIMTTAFLPRYTRKVMKIEKEALLMMGFGQAFPGFLSIQDENRTIVYLNPPFQRWLKQYTSVDPLGLSCQELLKFSTKSFSHIYSECQILTELAFGTNEKQEKIIAFLDQGVMRYFETTKFKQQINNKEYVYSISTDVSSLYEEKQYYQQQSEKDELTQLYNMRAFFHYEPSPEDTLIVLDLDNFKRVNDRFSHEMGNRVLQQFAQLLLRLFSRQATHFRYGGDEFLIFLKNHSQEEIEAQLKQLNRQFRAIFSTFDFLSVSYGFSSFIESKDKTFQIADLNMYENKKAAH